MSGRWWRAYDEALHDPKLQCLSDECFRFWFNLCCVCSAFKGNLPTVEHLAFCMRMQRRKVERLLTELRGAKLIDEDEQGIRPHNWHGRQYKSDVSTERVKRFRERRGNVSSAVSETPPETENRSREKDAATPPSAEKQLYDRGRQVLGDKAGGLVKNLLKARGGDIALARATIETASTKSDPREYVGAIIRSRTSASYVDGRL